MHARTPVVTEKHCEPVDLPGDTDVQHFPTFSEALEAFFPLTKAERKTAEAQAQTIQGRTDPEIPEVGDKKIR